MSGHPVTVHLPDAMYDPLQEVAQSRNESIEQVVINQLRSVVSVSLPDLPADEESELIAFKFLSDDTLRSIAREQMPAREQERMQHLMDGNTEGTLTAAERQELEQMVERGQRLMLRKAWAAGMLMERGHPITGDDFTHE